MGVDRAIDITGEQQRTIIMLLERHLPGATAWVYGSRAKWTSHPQSDLDLVVFPKPEQISHVASLREAFEESNLPFRVEIFAWDDMPATFRKQINAEHVVLPTIHNHADEWSKKSLQHLVEIRLSSVDKKIAPNERSVQLCNYTDVYYNSFIHSGIAFMEATATEREIEKCTLNPEDVIITKDSEKYDDIGVPALVKERIDGLVCGYHLAILRPLEHMHGPYVFYALSTKDVQQQFHSYANGITRFGLRKKDIGLVELPTPPLPQQRAIAHILGTLDDKIELNRCMNETLEAMAQALFKSWFIDFEPVRAKREGRISGLPQPLDDLFPRHLVDSEIGEIPAGWSVGSLDDIAISPRRSIDPTHVHVGTPYIGLGHMPRRSIVLTEWDSSAKITSNKYEFKKGEFLFGKLRPYFHKVGIAPVSGICSTDLLVVIPKDIANTAFVLMMISSDEFISYTDRTSTGTRMPRTSWSTMGRYVSCLPPASVAQAFQDLAEPILNKIVNNIHLNRCLAALRDELLPNLISGKIRLRDAERIVETAI